MRPLYKLTVVAIGLSLLVVGIVLLSPSLYLELYLYRLKKAENFYERLEVADSIAQISSRSIAFRAAIGEKIVKADLADPANALLVASLFVDGPKTDKNKITTIINSLINHPENHPETISYLASHSFQNNLTAAGWKALDALSSCSDTSPDCSTSLYSLFMDFPTNEVQKGLPYLRRLSLRSPNDREISEFILGKWYADGKITTTAIELSKALE